MLHCHQHCITSSWLKCVNGLQTDQRMPTAAHPQKDKQTARSHRTLEDMLQHPIEPAENDWDVKLPCCRLAVSNARNTAAGNTLFFLNLRDHLRTRVSVKIVTPLTAANSVIGRVSAAMSSEHDLLKAQHA